MSNISGLNLGPPHFPYKIMTKEQEKELSKMFKAIELYLFK